VIGDFTWHDGERRIRFGRGAIADAQGLLGEGYALLTTPRAADMAEQVVRSAADVHHVGPGYVDALAGELLEQVEGELIVALGGGRVIDVAKALAAARAGRRAAAIPTTLSAAEMTAVHRHAAGVAEDTPRVRPAIVVNDPDLSASQPAPDLAASAANSVAHAVEAPLTALAAPVPTMAAHEALRLTAAAYGDAQPHRERLALAALLSGYAIGAAWYGLHHVMSQTLVRVGGAGHGPANAAMLPHTAAALRRRFPERMAALDRAVGRPVEALAVRLGAIAGAESVARIGVERARLEDCARAAARRPELGLTPPRADVDELRAIYDQAW
jgi:alcohol dehydrogenase class IV